ncbi:MAG: VCBS repeat-containing protein [Cyclobacteriaceae bacterium]
MQKLLKNLLFLLPAFVLCNCGNKPEQLFQLVEPVSSCIQFSNDLIYTDTLTVLDFEYLYNGAGVGIGDINNDGLQDIYFSGNMTSGKLYLNKGNWKFEDITTQAGLATSVWVNGVTMVDINRDGFKDIYLCVAGTRHTPAAKKKNLLFINNGNSTFTESASTYGLQGTGHNIQSTFFDYDKDGDLDVYLLRNAFVDYSRNRARPKSVKGESSTTDQLYRNNGDNTFTDVSNEAGILIEGFGLGVQVCDINDDGWPDVYVSNDFITNDLLYINNHDGTFSNKASQYFKHATYNAMGNDVADINNDGLVDVVELDMLPEDNLRWKVTIMGNNYDEFENGLKFGYEPQYVRNTLQLNSGNGTFSEIGYLAGIEATDWSWSPLLADYDNDGLKDLFITNGYRQDITNLDFIKFSERTLRMGTVEGNKKERVEMLKKIPGIQVHNYMYKNNGDLTFSDQSKSWGLSEPSFSNGAVYADLDNDGDLDLVINNIDAPATLYKNTKSNSENKTSNFLRISFDGPPLNHEGFGAKVYLRNAGKLQYQYFSPFRGFLSTVEPYLHFGLNNATNVDSLEVVWPDGKYELLKNVNANQVLTLKYTSASHRKEEKKLEAPLLFAEASKELGLDYKHQENDFVDFKVQPLLPHMHSKNGPGIAVTDVNGDGLEDFYVGGATNQSGALFIQEANGKFKKSTFSKTATLTDDMGVLFFDVDNDGDADMYIASGGCEQTKNSSAYQDHLYLNDGKGKFENTPNALPEIFQSGSSVVAADYDRDGDLDLFVGGRIIPAEYPMPVDSYILRNDTQNNSCKFTDVTKEIAPSFLKLGLVTSTLWTDVDNDGWLDLLIVGEFMPITCYKNNNGKSFTSFGKDSFTHTTGWWNSLTAGDFDNDGDTDYIAGNVGLNTRYKANEKEPLCIYASDYDKNGSIDPVMSLYIQGEKQVAHSWDDMVKQMNPIRARFRTYQPYAEATFEKSFTKTELESAYKVCSEWFQSSYIENVGGGKFSVKALPVQVQFSPVYGMVAGDYNADGNLDVLMVGNSYSTEVSTGRYDASIGLYLQGDGKGNFTSVNVTKSGFMVDKDVKGLAKLILHDGRELILAGVNNDQLKAHAVRAVKKYFTASANDSYAIVKFKNGKTRRYEFYYGSTYLSQSSRTMELSDEIVSFEVYDFAGKKRPL